MLSGRANAIFLQYLNPKSAAHCLSPTFLAALTRTINIPNFIETGTFEGFTTEAALQFFSSINTFELSCEHYVQACEKFSHHAHVHPHWGDSGRVLRTILPKLKGQTLFWLDAHFSGCGTAFEGCGTPIIQELEAIKSNNDYRNAIIMIDDIRLFDLIPPRSCADAGQDFPDLAQIYDKLMEINTNFTLALLGDTLIAVDPDKKITVSPVVHACTQSRLSKSLNLSDEEVRVLETAILHAPEPEKNTFRALYSVYCNPNSNTPSPYYHVWFGLTLLADKQFEQAAQQFERAIALGFNPPRVQNYLQNAHEQGALYLEEQNALSAQRQMIQNLQRLNAQHEQERTLLIEAQNKIQEQEETILQLLKQKTLYEEELMRYNQTLGASVSEHEADEQEKSMPVEESKESVSLSDQARSDDTFEA